ncbi:MAG: branched-chain amino acid ABC transporter substrate-binding protein, partial [Rhodovulum sp.]
MRSAVLRVDYPSLLPLSRLDLPVEDLGLAGAAVGTEDNATTGRFMGQTYDTVTRAVAPGDLAAAFEELVGQGIRLFVVLAREDELLALADAAPADALILNARSGARSLRSEDCRANLLHIAPSDAMRADALVQFLVWKKWTDLFLVHGSNPAD